LYYSDSSPIPLLTSPLKGEEDNAFPPLQGEGKGGGGINQMFIMDRLITGEYIPKYQIDVSHIHF
jgi:hypothetical protein